MTRVSVIIPAYNGAATIAYAIDSVLAQSFDGPVETIVVNDGSTDSTAQVLDAYASRITVVTQPNRGVAAARNAGAAASAGEYLAFLDADNTWLPGFLTMTCAALDGSPRAVLAFTDAEGIDQQGRPQYRPSAGRSPSMKDLLCRRWQIYVSAVVMRRRMFDRCGGFSAEFVGMGFEDAYMWLRAREHGEFAFVPAALMVHRAPDWPAAVDKYEPGREVFNRLVRQRYGPAAEPLIRFWTSMWADGVTLKASMQTASGDGRGAAQSWLRLLRLSPLHLFDRRYARALFRPRAQQLLAGLFRPAMTPRTLERPVNAAGGPSCDTPAPNRRNTRDPVR
jgi:glycosyltransferase involved in cell wall biosynthesis